jgi:hypothetical protein
MHNKDPYPKHIPHTNHRPHQNQHMPITPTLSLSQLLLHLSEKKNK